jgi:hypothetical protein
MARKRAQILVEVDLDPIPGWGNNPQDFVNYLQRTLDGTLGHYNPTVSLVMSQVSPTTNAEE